MPAGRRDRARGVLGDGRGLPLRPRRARDADRQLLALHAPEELGFDVTVRDRNAQVGVVT